jgi:phage terminase large subunit-like protein
VGQLIGRPLHPHQRQIVDVAGELLPDGTPAYSEVAVVMPRRGGKTVTVLARLLEQLRRDAGARAFYTAQGAEEATKVLRDEWAPIIQQSPLKKVMRFRMARGDAGMFVQVGKQQLGRAEIFTPNASALHGRDADLVVVDEAWFFDADRGADIDAGIRPARWARPASQLWYVSAGGTEGSTWLHRIMDRGRAGAPGLAYFEWSADASAPGYDPYDEDLWINTHPGIGTTVSLATMRADAAAMTQRDFERALLCVWDRAAGTQLLAGWESCIDPTAAPTGPLVLAFDVSPSRDTASVALAGGGAVQLIDHRPGTGWLAERIVELADRHGVTTVIRDPRGPAGATELGHGLVVVDVSSRELSEACAWMVDALRRGLDGLRIRPRPELSLAFANATAATRGDGQAIWVRRTADADLSPLYAVNLASWAADTLPVPAIY